MTVPIDFSATLKHLESALQVWVETFTGFLESYDPESISLEEQRRNWELIILLAIRAGMTDEDFQIELGASSSTVYRWLNENKMPRTTSQKGFIQGIIAAIKKHSSV